MLIDTHAHVNFNAYKDDGEEVVARALAQDIWLINVGSEKDTSRRAVGYAQKYERGVFAAVGLHPGHLAAMEYEEEIKGERVKFSSSAEIFDEQHYFNLAKDSKVVAIGEIGLDYYRMAMTCDVPKLNSPILGHRKSKSDVQINAAKNLQKEVLLEQLGLAEKLNKPVILHCREAHEDLLKVLRTWTLVGNKPLRGIIHSFSGRWSQAEQYLAMGFHLGFNGIITFAHDYDQVIKEMPLNKLVLETDCPYLTPIPFRGKRNEPGYVKYVAEKIAELRNISVAEVAEITTQNARKLFNI